MKHEHDCGRAGCKMREKQKPTNHPRNNAKARYQAMVKAWHAIHGVEHDRSGCKQGVT